MDSVYQPTSPVAAEASPATIARTRLAIAVAVAGVVVGVVWDALTRNAAPGIGAVCAVAIGVGGVAAVNRMRKVGLQRGALALLWLAPVFALSFLLRDSGVLTAVVGSCIGLAVVLAALRGRSGSLLVSEATEYLRGIFQVAVFTLIGGIAVPACDITWSALPKSPPQRQAGTVLRGVLVALPLLIVFAALFSQADAEFRALINRLFDWNIAQIAQEIGWILLYTLGAAGVLRTLLIEEWKPASTEVGSWPKLAGGDVVVALSLLNALSLAFVIVQLPLLFGGAHAVRTIPGMSYAQYARSGFFELVWVTVLVLPTLLSLHWLMRKASVTHTILFRVLSFTLIILLYVIMLSAVQRMHLYIIQFGLTELRLYTTVFMAWLALVYVWFIATVLRDRRDRFAFGAIVAGFTVIGALCASNPDRQIVSYNVSRAKTFDAAYAASLSADAVPTLVDALARNGRAQNAPQAAATLLSRWGKRDADWRGWNLSRERAYAAVSRDAEGLARLAVQPPQTPPA